MNSQGRIKMDVYIRKSFPALDLPKDPDWLNATIFDFFVSDFFYLVNNCLQQFPTKQVKN